VRRRSAGPALRIFDRRTVAPGPDTTSSARPGQRLALKPLIASLTNSGQTVRPQPASAAVNGHPGLNGHGLSVPAVHSKPTDASPSSLQGASPSRSSTASPSRLPSSPLNAAFTGIARNLQWRPKTVTKNPDYPRVTAPGCYWQDHSGGFHLL